jgi:hypothetical protein
MNKVSIYDEIIIKDLVKKITELNKKFSTKENKLIALACRRVYNKWARS